MHFGASAGVSNQVILENLKRRDATQKPVIVRVPLIPDYTDSKANLYHGRIARACIDRPIGQAFVVRIAASRKIDSGLAYLIRHGLSIPAAAMSLLGNFHIVESKENFRAVNRAVECIGFLFSSDYSCLFHRANGD
ncbi:MAG: hypothetical protein JXA73_25895 [Acidobacteria bacterium]|nr:hypothetical protein [Acidobacteriota bacterium]